MWKTFFNDFLGYLLMFILRREYTPPEFVEGILKGNITILSQAVTLVESAKYEHQQIAQEIMKNVFHMQANQSVSVLRVFPEPGKVRLSMLSACT